MPLLFDVATEKLSSFAPMPIESWQSQRLFHGRGRCYPEYEQVCVDLFTPILLLTIFKPLDESFEAILLNDLKRIAQQYSLAAVQVQRRYLAGTPSTTLLGQLPESLFALRDGLRFNISVDRRQNIGFFLDIERGRQWLAQRANDKNVLNLFSYTCAFSVVAQAAGAALVVNVDMSKSALAQGRSNHRLNNQATDNIKFLSENILKSWSRVCRPGPYDIAIIDPPSYQPGSFVAEKDYAKLLRRIPQFMRPGGELLLCLNSPEKDETFIQVLIEEHCPECTFVERLTELADFPDEDINHGLKLLVYRYA